jgi:urease accessory protein
MIVLVGNALEKYAGRLLAGANASPMQTRRASLLVTGSPIEGGALVRVAGEQVEEVSREIRRLLAFVSEILEDDPWIRKS